MKKIVLAGPPRSGKSCLREGLKDAIRAIPGAPYPYVITACPDGEGAWFQKAAERDPQLARECKEAYKASFTPEFVTRVSESVSNCSLELTLIDVGGIPSQENLEICRDATHIVILSSDPSKIHVWRIFAARLGLHILAEVESKYTASEDVVAPLSGEILTGSVHHLERGEPLADRPMVQALAQHILTA